MGIAPSSLAEVGPGPSLGEPLTTTVWPSSWVSFIEMPFSADAVVMIPGDDRSVSWASDAAVFLLSWLSVALVVGTIVGHGIAFSNRRDSE